MTTREYIMICIAATFPVKPTIIVFDTPDTFQWNGNWRGRRVTGYATIKGRLIRFEPPYRTFDNGRKPLRLV